MLSKNNNLDSGIEAQEIAKFVMSTLDKYRRVAIVGAKITDVSFCIQSLLEYARLEKKARHKKKEFEFILKGDNTFDELTVAESIYFQEHIFFGTKRRAIYRKCQAAFDYFGLNIDLMSKILMLKQTDKKIVETMRAYLLAPQIIISDDTMAELGFNHTETYINIINESLNRNPNCKTIYCTTRWEDAIKIADHLIVINNEKIEGALDRADVIKNPRQLVKHLIGDYITEVNNGDNNEYFEVLNTIFKGAEFMSSSFELGSALEFIAENVKKTIDCMGCYIYLSNMSDMGVKLISYCDKYTALVGAKIDYDAVKRYFERNEDIGVLYVSERDKNFTDFICSENNMIKTIFGFPILLKSNKIGYLIVWYDKYYVYSEKQLLIQSAFANEVAIIVETANLMNKSFLLQESHHRIKNNLQIIISLLYMQNEQIKMNNNATITNDVIKSMVNRVKSIASVHDLLTDTQNNQIVNAKDLLLDVLGFYYIESINIETDIEEIYIAQKSAVSIALIMNEILNNCIKHAFIGLADDYYKSINISMNIIEDNVVLAVEDNGVGMQSDFKKMRSLGMTIVKTLVEKEFKGRIYVKVDNGTKVEIILPKGEVFSIFAY